MSNALALPTKERVSSELKRRFFLRLHMTLILSATFSAGLLTTKLLLAAHFNNLAARYVIAVCAAFAVFLGAIKLWLAYVGYLALRGTGSLDINGDGFVFGGGSSGGGGADVPRFSGGGGSGGGGGATGSWGSGSSSSSGGSSSGGGIDFGDDGALLLLIVVLVLAIAAAAFYLIWAAPAILSEAAFNAALAAALARRAKKVSFGGWVESVFRATALPFLAVALLAGVTGWYAHKHCPSATRLREAVHCATAQ